VLTAVGADNYLLLDRFFIPLNHRTYSSLCCRHMAKPNFNFSCYHGALRCARATARRARAAGAPLPEHNIAPNDSPCANARLIAFYTAVPRAVAWRIVSWRCDSGTNLPQRHARLDVHARRLNYAASTDIKRHRYLYFMMLSILRIRRRNDPAFYLS